MAQLTSSGRRALKALIKVTPCVDQRCREDGHTGLLKKDEPLTEKHFVACGGAGFLRQVGNSDLIVHGVRVELKEAYDRDFKKGGLTPAFLPHQLWDSFHGHTNGGPTPLAVLRVLHESPPRTEKYKGLPAAGDPTTFLKRALSEISEKIGDVQVLQQPAGTYFFIALDGERLDGHCPNCQPSKHRQSPSSRGAS